MKVSSKQVQESVALSSAGRAKIHVVSFQVPWPADYGGAIDVYYKLKVLHEAGVAPILHTFIYGERQEQPKLNEICEEVHYYPRSLGWKKQCSMLPYIVATRDNERLLDNLCRDDYPILFEGLHTCYFLDHPRLKDRRKFVRMHNIEHEYYHRLAIQNGWNWRSLYYRIESLRLRRFESMLTHAEAVLAITKADMQALHNRYPDTNAIHLPCFFDTQPLEEWKEGIETEQFVLYHGNLAVEENARIAQYIVRQLAPQCPGTLFVIAGRNPQIEHLPHNVKLFANPADSHLDQLIQTAHIHLMLTKQPTGIKLKLLNTLAKGRGHIIANREMLYGHSLGRYCVRADKTEEITRQIESLMQQPLSESALADRRKGLLKMRKAGISRLSLLQIGISF